MPTSGLPSRFLEERQQRVHVQRAAHEIDDRRDLLDIRGVSLDEDLVDRLGGPIRIGAHQVAEDGRPRAARRGPGSAGRKPPVSTTPMTWVTGAAARFSSTAARRRSSRSPGVISSVRSRRNSTACVACMAPIAVQPIVLPGVASPGKELALQVRRDQLERGVGEQLGVRDAARAARRRAAAGRARAPRAGRDGTRRRPC